MGLTRRHLYSLITATREVPGGAAFGVRISGPPLLGKTSSMNRDGDDKNGARLHRNAAGNILQDLLLNINARSTHMYIFPNLTDNLL